MIASLDSSDIRLEVEAKFEVADLAGFRERLVAAGGKLERERVHEWNVRFDTPDDDLLEREALLRLRQDTSITLTFKGLTQSAESSEVKVREELEIKADDFDMTAAILNRLGFIRKQVYEKYREAFHYGELEIVLDEMPIGNFVELEGPEEEIRRVADELGLAWKERITTNYLELFELIRTAYDLPFEDLTFANFAGVSVNVSKVLT